MKCKWYVLTAIALFVVALGLLLYPLIGEVMSEKYHSDVETTYIAAIAGTDDAELTAQRQAAQQYNAMLANAMISEVGLLPLPWPTPTSSRWAVPWLSSKIPAASRTRNSGIDFSHEP